MVHADDRTIADAAEQALIARAIGGDGDALREVWERHRRWVAAILLAHKPRDADVEDLLQDVAVMLVSKVSDVREAGAFKPWLRAVTLSVALAKGRRSTVRRNGFLRVVDGWLGRPSQEKGGGDDGAGTKYAAVSQEAKRLLELARSLPEGYGEPLILKAVQGMSYREIGRVMGLPESTVETRIVRARRMLRERAMQDGLDRDGNSMNERHALGAPVRTEVAKHALATNGARP